ncbi:MAG: heme-binding beta-barrel domain-containing protein [Micropepsaceae bacterium]
MVKPELHASLAEWRLLLGTWIGVGEGQPGKSKVERTYEATLEGRYILAQNQSTYAPQEKNPEGEVHNDIGYYSLDKARKRLVFRQFHVEGFVTQYVASTERFDGRTLVLDSELIENIPIGWRARETYQFNGPDAFEEVFELAEPGKDFEVYAHNRLRRT